MEAIVLAGGKGTRLQSVVSDVPKPMAPIGDMPFLEYILKYLKRNGVHRVILSVGYKRDIIQNYFSNSFEGIELVYSSEDEPLGTGGAIKKALEQVKTDELYIINGDTFFDIDLQQLALQENSKIVLALKTMHDFDRYGCVECDKKNVVTNFSEKEYRTSGNINGGIYLISKNIFQNYELEEIFSFEEFMQKEYNNLNITAKIFDGYFIDIGIPEDYERAQTELKKIM